MIAGDTFCTVCGATADPGDLEAVSHSCSVDRHAEGAYLELGFRGMVAQLNEADARAGGPPAMSFLLRLRRRRGLTMERAA